MPFSLAKGGRCANPWGRFKPGAHDLMLLKGLKKHGVGVHYARLLRARRWLRCPLRGLGIWWPRVDATPAGEEIISGLLSQLHNLVMQLTS